MSATGFLDACGFFPAAGGTADFVVSSAATGYQTPASAGATNGAVYSYRAQSTDMSEWEIGFGAYATGTTTLARTTVVASSTGSKVNFSSPPAVYITALSADLQRIRSISIRTFTSSGTYIPSSGVIYAVVECVGGGGGGGNAASTSSGQASVGGGGGGGGYCRKTFVPSGSVAVTVGAGGASETVGGTTSFGSICYASGGNGAGGVGPISGVFSILCRA